MSFVIKADMSKFDPRIQMAELFADGFMQWLTFFSKDKDIIAKAFAHMFDLDQFYIAVDGGKVVGMIACTNGYSSSVTLNTKELRNHLGFYKGSLAGIFLKKEFSGGIQEPMPGKGSIEFVGTSSEYRGKGVATMIFRHIIDNTPYTEYVIDEVADTNAAAINLYQKWGFEEYKRIPVPEKNAKKIKINNFISFKYCK